MAGPPVSGLVDRLMETKEPEADAYAHGNAHVAHAGSVEELQQTLGRTGDHGPVPDHHDRPLDEHRVGDKSVEERVPVGTVQAELPVAVLTGSGDRSGVVGAEQPQHPLEVGPRRRPLQVLDQLGVDAPLIEQPTHRAALGASGVEEDGDIFLGHGWKDTRAEP